MTYLLYVNDVIIIYEVSEVLLMYPNWTIMWFEVIFEWKVNMKNELILVGRIDNIPIGKVDDLDACHY